MADTTERSEHPSANAQRPAAQRDELGTDPLSGGLDGQRLSDPLATIQLRGGAPAPEQASAAADAALSGPSGELPHADRIQASFGRHDVSGIEAHTDDTATSALEGIGAEGLAAGDRVATRAGADLFTAAHEAAHVVQQRAGVHLSQGVAGADDRYEHHADRVAERVVAGESAEALLDEVAGASDGSGSGPSGPGAVQWRWVVDHEHSEYFWEEDGSPRPDVPAPLRGLRERAAPRPGTYQVDSGRSRRMPLYLSLDQWMQMHGGGPSRAPRDVYNPFGRFATAGRVAFIPASGLSKEVQQSTLERLREAIDVAGIASAGAVDGSGYPESVTTAEGELLGRMSASQLGAIYSDRAPIAQRAQRDPRRARDPRGLGLPSREEGHKIAENTVEPRDVDYWSGRGREVDQSAVMGGNSAADAAENAGYDRHEGLGWEWLHLIAHSMGGIEVHGPQVAGNLVCGTSECNTQMIMVEELIKDLVRKGHRARLFVAADLADPARHIAERIVYDFVILDERDRPIDAFHWAFDPLSRSQPLAEENRGLRYAARTMLHGRQGVAPKDPDDDMMIDDQFDVEDGPSAPDEAREMGLHLGDADGTGNMCLLDSLAQLLQAHGHQVETNHLIAFFRGAGLVQVGQMIDVYNPAVAQAIVGQYGVQLQVHQWTPQGYVHHPVVGNAGPVLHLHHDQNHFVPMWHGF